ncbi:MAG: hypothetical protein Q7S88_03390 [Candidatus Daviesbacteria bacterium]|nr:hypothetical protein [Candidatus Daviesbacteria bacterium]
MREIVTPDSVLQRFSQFTTTKPVLDTFTDLSDPTNLNLRGDNQLISVVKDFRMFSLLLCGPSLVWTGQNRPESLTLYLVNLESSRVDYMLRRSEEGAAQYWAHSPYLASIRMASIPEGFRTYLPEKEIELFQNNPLVSSVKWSLPSEQFNVTRTFVNCFAENLAKAEAGSKVKDNTV